MPLHVRSVDSQACRTGPDRFKGALRFPDEGVDGAHITPELARVRGKGYDQAADDFAQGKHRRSLTLSGFRV